MDGLNYGKSYAKRPLWQWAAIYLGIAAVAYGLIYYFVWGRSGGYQGPVSAPSSTAPQKSGQVPAATVFISTKDFQFDPAGVNIKKGTIVKWTNNDSASHTVTGDDGGPVSSPMRPGESYSYTFDKIGTFSYHCSIHPSMKAAVQVTE